MDIKGDYKKKDIETQDDPDISKDKSSTTFTLDEDIVYRQTIMDLSYKGHIYNLLIFYLSHFIYMNYQHNIGIIVGLISVCSFLIHILLGVKEYKLVMVNQKELILSYLNLHFIIVQIIFCFVSTTFFAVVIYMVARHIDRLNGYSEHRYHNC